MYITYRVEYASLKYYNNVISEECLYIGMLFHNLTTGKRDFRYISNFKSAYEGSNLNPLPSRSVYNPKKIKASGGIQYRQMPLFLRFPQYFVHSICIN